jgi:type I restriction enzyme S subunit
MKNWKTCELGDLITFQRGHDLSKSQVVTGQYPIAGSNGIIGYHHKFTTKAPSITIGRSGNIGNPHLYEVDFWAHNTALYIKEFKNSDPKFIFYLLKTLDFTGHNSGSAVPSLNRNFIHPMKVFVPESIEEQKAIARILSSLDDKIELNRRINETLEATARILFKAWFIDFEPTRANIETRPSKSVSPDMAKLFPSEFENGIPKGWREIKLGELIDTISVTHKFPKDEIIFLNTSDISDGQVLSSKYSKVEGLPGQAKKSIKKNDILYSEIRPANKRFAYIDFDADDYVVSTKLMVLRTKSFVDSILIYDFLKSEEVVSHLQMLAESRSGTFPQITFEQIKRLEILIPNLEVLEIYTRFLKSIFEKTNQNVRQNQKLAEIRDSLLPRLISGKIPVSKIENEAKGENE